MNIITEHLLFFGIMGAVVLATISILYTSVLPNFFRIKETIEIKKTCEEVKIYLTNTYITLSKLEKGSILEIKDINERIGKNYYTVKGENNKICIITKTLSYCENLNFEVRGSCLSSSPLKIKGTKNDTIEIKLC